MTLSREGCSLDPSECRISSSSAIKQPAIEWSPIFDGTGAMVNSDPNTIVVTYTCTACLMTWSTETTGGVTISVTPLPTSAPIEGEQP